MSSRLVHVLETITAPVLQFHQSAMLSGSHAEISRPLKTSTHWKTEVCSQILFNSTAPCLFPISTLCELRTKPQMQYKTRLHYSTSDTSV